MPTPLNLWAPLFHLNRPLAALVIHQRAISTDSQAQEETSFTGREFHSCSQGCFLPHSLKQLGHWTDRATVLIVLIHRSKYGWGQGSRFARRPNPGRYGVHALLPNGSDTRQCCVLLCTQPISTWVKLVTDQPSAAPHALPLFIPLRTPAFTHSS